MEKIPVKHTSQGMIQNVREDLYEAIQKVKEGTMDYKAAQTIATIAQTIINSVTIELKYNNLLMEKERLAENKIVKKSKKQEATELVDKNYFIEEK